jgi:3-hydroxyisobutyrate dehydrogenase-like beta-hydroxyacid dehydrogenase
LIAELNAIAPSTVLGIEAVAAENGDDLVDGSISGPPPWKPGTTRLYLSGPRAAQVAALPFEGVDLIVVGPKVGAASAVKMSTASVYKGSSALLMQALLTARANGVLEHVLADLGTASPTLVAGVERRLASAATKSRRYVAEMHEIAATQTAAGLTPALFEAMAEIYTALGETPLARASPEELPPELSIQDVLDGLR